MAHIGILSPPVPGHLHPFAALGRELVSRGHRVTVFQVEDLEEKIRAEGIKFCGIGQSDHPRGSLAESLKQLSKLDGLAALRFTVAAVARTSVMTMRDAPSAIRKAGVGALLVDQMEPAGGAIAEHLGLPFITICNALPINRDLLVPPPFTAWNYRTEGWAKLRNRVGYAASERMLRPIQKAVAIYRKTWRLPSVGSPDETFSKLAQISQLPREFDYPRAQLPACFHYVGPLRRDLPAQTPFPWDRLDGRPLIYASLGTLQNRREPLFRCIAEACQGLDAQLVLSHGGGLSPEEAEALPGNPVVVGYAPQLAVLERAQLTITHSGLNTVLDSLLNGVPMVAIPITYEQPAIAQRLKWTGTGRFLPLAKLDASRLREVARDVLQQSNYRDAARRMAESIQRAGGVRVAADIVESALASVSLRN